MCVLLYSQSLVMAAADTFPAREDVWGISQTGEWVEQCEAWLVTPILKYALYGMSPVFRIPYLQWWAPAFIVAFCGLSEADQARVCTELECQGRVSEASQGAIMTQLAQLGEPDRTWFKDVCGEVKQFVSDVQRHMKRDLPAVRMTRSGPKIISRIR